MDDARAPRRLVLALAILLSGCAADRMEQFLRRDCYNLLAVARTNADSVRVLRTRPWSGGGEFPECAFWIDSIPNRRSDVR